MMIDSALTLGPLDWFSFQPGQSANHCCEEESPEPAMVIIEGRDDQPDCIVAYLNQDMPEATQDAYALLFSAAPDLLRECRNAAAWFRENGYPAMTKQLYAAIDKAEAD
jgi:hypothetical protein